MKYFTPANYRNSNNNFMSQPQINILAQQSLNIKTSFNNTITPKSLNNNFSVPFMFPPQSLPMPSVPSLQLLEPN